MYPKTWEVDISRPPTTGTDGSLGSGPLISRDLEEMMNLRTEAVDFPARQRAVVTVSEPDQAKVSYLNAERLFRLNDNMTAG